MDKNYFKKLRVMDGGMGQELHAKGLISKGTLWSTSAILDEKYHKLIVCLLYTSPSPRDRQKSRMPSSA